ncbi:hypothetical protein ACP4OV_014824 [Aristida adscensionis]
MDAGKNSPPPPMADGGSRKRVCYYYDPRIFDVDYGAKHPMVPRRVSMAHALVRAYDLLDDMDLLRVAPATKEDLMPTHDGAYLDLLRDLTPAAYHRDGGLQAEAGKRKLGQFEEQDRRGCWKINDDNPVIAGLWDYCLRYAGGSLAAARALAGGGYRVAINWSGGMHHACHGEAGGFCYVNDIVVAVRALLGRFRRVLYVDVDAHHGDGVEAAFADDPRVMTVSFHQYDGVDFFPGTGKVDDVGGEHARYRALNVPLEAGTGDERYHALFRPITARAMEVFRPGAVVLQSGADSLAGDRIAGLGLSVRGHAKCLRLLLGYDVPLLLLGGGGYTINHVAACWCYETAVAIGKEIPNEIPEHGYKGYYKSQDYELHYGAEGGGGGGETKHMADVKRKVMGHLDKLAAELSRQPDEEEPPDQGVAVFDGGALLERSPAGGEEEEDPVEVLHRRCGEEDLAKFLIHLGRTRARAASQERTRTTPEASRRRR